MALFSSGLFYMNSVLLELFLYCWFGNEVSVKSVKISQALYESIWPDCPQNFKRNLHFFLMRAQRPIKLYAVNFFHLSLGVFVWVKNEPNYNEYVKNNLILDL